MHLLMALLQRMLQANLDVDRAFLRIEPAEALGAISPMFRNQAVRKRLGC